MIKKTSMNLPDDLYQRFKTACAVRRTTIGAATIEAIERWINDTKNRAEDGTQNIQLASFNDEVSPVEMVWVNKLLMVLRLGGVDCITGIQISLEAYEAVAGLGGLSGAKVAALDAAKNRFGRSARGGGKGDEAQGSGDAAAQRMRPKVAG